MKYSVMSDIHSNYTALKACVNYSIENNVDGFIFLEDHSGRVLGNSSKSFRNCLR